MGMPYNPMGQYSRNSRNAYQGGGYQGWQGSQYFQGGMPNSGGQNMPYRPEYNHYPQQGGGGMQGGYNQYPGYQLRKRGPGGRPDMPYQSSPQMQPHRGMQAYSNYRY